MLFANTPSTQTRPKLPSLRSMWPWMATLVLVWALWFEIVPTDFFGFAGSPRTTLAWAFVGTMLAQLPTTLYLHRNLAHGSVTFNKYVAWVMRFGLWVLVGLKPWQWMAVHKWHHMNEDEEQDPHTPVYLGFFEILFNNVKHYNGAMALPEVRQLWERHYQRDSWDNWFDKSWLGHLIGYLIAVTLAGPVGGLVIVLVHPRLYVLLSGAVNAVGHAHGYMRQVRGKLRFTGNSLLLALLTWGEGLHDNHHIAPYSATMARTRWELLFDPGFWVLKVLAWLGLAKIRHRDTKEPGDMLHFPAAARQRRQTRAMLFSARAG
jgi:stearoyl-CoA desaturase (Delta-9 desaturase)